MSDVPYSSDLEDWDKLLENEPEEAYTGPGPGTRRPSRWKRRAGQGMGPPLSPPPPPPPESPSPPTVSTVSSIAHTASATKRRYTREPRQNRDGQRDVRASGTIDTTHEARSKDEKQLHTKPQGRPKNRPSLLASMGHGTGKDGGHRHRPTVVKHAATAAATATATATATAIATATAATTPASCAESPSHTPRRALRLREQISPVVYSIEDVSDQVDVLEVEGTLFVCFSSVSICNAHNRRRIRRQAAATQNLDAAMSDVDVDGIGRSISKFYIPLIPRLPFFLKWRKATYGFEMCFDIGSEHVKSRCCFTGPGTLGAGAKTRLHTPKAVTYHEQPDYCRFMIGHSLGGMDSRIKKFTPHCICRPRCRRSRGMVPRAGWSMDTT